MTEEREECPFNHTKMCPHIGLKGALWCQVCVMSKILKEIKLLRVSQS